MPSSMPRLVSPAGGVTGQPINPTLRWAAIPYASEYRVEIDTSPTFDGPAYQSLTSITTSVEADSLLPFAVYYWRVRGESPLFATLFSESYRFATSDVQRTEIGFQTIPGSSSPAFLEVVGPGGVDPCGPDVESPLGCSEAGGNLVYGSYNSTGEYVMYHAGAGPDVSLGDFAPNDFEIRFTSTGLLCLSHLWGVQGIMGAI